MSEWVFTKVTDLESLFEEGVIVSFDSDGIAAGNLDDKWTIKNRVRPRWGIRIDRREEFHRNNNANTPPWNTTFLEEQKATLLHEILHWWRAVKGLEPQRPRLALSQSQYIENEKIIDQAAFGIVKERPDLMDVIVLELSTRRTCRFQYECSTPFLQYHRDLILRYLKGIGVPKFGDERTIRLLRFMSANQTF